MRQVANASNHRGNHGFTSGNHLNLIKPAAVGDGLDNGMVLITFSVAGVVRFKRTGRCENMGGFFITADDLLHSVPQMLSLESRRTHGA